MKVIHSGESYDCSVAVKCENDRYIILYDESGAEIIAFNGISDFAEYEISGGSFVEPKSSEMPLPLSTYTIGGRTITTNDWVFSDGKYIYEIESNLISANITTCNIVLLFEEGTSLEHTKTQEEGKVIIHTTTAPTSDIVLDSIQITRI